MHTDDSPERSEKPQDLLLEPEPSVGFGALATAEVIQEGLMNGIIATQKDQFQRNGVVMMPGFIHRGQLTELVAEYDAAEAELTNREIFKHEPIVVFWNHVIGETKRIKKMSEMPLLAALAKDIAGRIKPFFPDQSLTLLETIIFIKPALISNTLRWHQDVAYFPFEPNDQAAVWVPFDRVTRETGALLYAIGSHKLGDRGSIDLHSGEAFDGETRPLIPDDPRVEGCDIYCAEAEVGDMLIHNGRTWHMSGPNTVAGSKRRGLSLRFILGDTYYKPRAGSAAAFIKQIEIEAGQKIDDPAFPVLA